MTTIAGRATTEPTAERRAGARSVLVSAILGYLVLEACLPRYFEAPRVGVSLSLVLAGGLAAYGWLTRSGRFVAIGPYLLAASAFGAWSVIAAAAAWDTEALTDSVAIAVWFAFIVGGLAQLLRSQLYRNVVIAAFVASAVTYGVVVLSREIRGMSVLDAFTEDRVVGLILGRNRNLVSMGAMVALPFLAENVGPRLLRVLRWPLFAVALASVLYGGGRSGLLGLATLAIAYALLRRAPGQRLNRLALLGILGALGILLTQSIGGSVATSTDRLLGYIGGEKEHSDDVRELMIRKAWHLGMDHPAFGIGYGNFETTYHPVIEEAPNLSVYRDAQRFTPHSTYARALAEMGIPGAVAFLALVASVVLIAVRRSRDREARAAVVGWIGLAAMMGFDAVLGGQMIYLAVALVLGAASAAAARDDARPER